EHDAEEAEPGPARMSRVQLIGPAPQSKAERLAVERVEVAADEIARGVTSEGVARKEHDVRDHDQRPETDAEPAAEAQRRDRVEPQDREHRDREVERVAVKVLKVEWEAGLAAILRARIGH